MADFGFVGGAYEAESRYQDAQELINWYCEYDKDKAQGERGAIALYPTPGLLLASNPAGSYPVRALHTLSGNQHMLAVIGAALYSFNTSMVPTFAGNLNTSSGNVSISDNGIQAMIVDGANRYSYATNGAQNAVFTGSITTGILTVTAMTSGTVLVGQILTGAGISTGTVITYALTGTGGLGTYGVSVTTTAGSTSITATGGLVPIPTSDGPFVGGDIVDTIDNYFVYNYPGTQQWGASNALSTTSPALSFASKFSAEDKLVAIAVNNRIVYLLGEVTTEAWSDVGSFPFPFALIPGSTAQHGCAAKGSVAQLGDSFAYVSRDRKGQGIIVIMSGYAPVRISTHAVETSLAGQTISDAVAYSYQLNGHEFYAVTFPTVDITWVYDLMTEKWHKWLSTDANGVYHRNRINCMAVFNGQIYAGDCQNGNIYSISNSVYTENGGVIRRMRRCPHLVADFARVFHEELQIQFQPGVGLQNAPAQLSMSGIVNGVNTSFTLLNSANQPISGLSGIPTIYKTDWQGNQLQYTTARTNYALRSEELNTAPWAGCSVTSSGQLLGGIVPFWNVAKVLGVVSESLSQTGIVSVVNGDTITMTVAMMAGNSTQAMFGIYGSVSGYGVNGDSSGSIVSGPGTLIQWSGGSYKITGLSATVPTLVTITRTFRASENAGAYLYPDTTASTTIGASNLFTRVMVEKNVAAWTSYIKTTTAAVTVTDYTLSPPSTITFSVAPLTGSTLVWSTTGVNQVSNPQAMLRWSDDGGSTWSNEHWLPIGLVGKYKHRILKRRIGYARDRVYEVSVSDPVFATVISANLKIDVGE